MVFIFGSGSRSGGAVAFVVTAWRRRLFRTGYRLGARVFTRVQIVFAVAALFLTGRGIAHTLQIGCTQSVFTTITVAAIRIRWGSVRIALG